MESVTLVKDGPKLCPKCGRPPRVITSLFTGGYYAICPGHAETKVVATAEEAIRLWNKDELER